MGTCIDMPHSAPANPRKNARLLHFPAQRGARYSRASASRIGEKFGPVAALLRQIKKRGSVYTYNKQDYQIGVIRRGGEIG